MDGMQTNMRKRSLFFNRRKEMYLTLTGKPCVAIFTNGETSVHHGVAARDYVECVISIATVRMLCA